MDGVKSLLNDAQNAGLTVKAEDDRLVVEGPKSAESIALQVLDRKPEVMAVLADQVDRETDVDETIDWWQHITDEDREYLLGPEVDSPPTVEQLARLKAWQVDRHPGKCFFCGGRKVHASDCFIATYESVLPFGRYKSRLVSEVPKDYLIWLLKNSTSLNPDLRVEIERTIQKAKSPSRMLQFTQESTLIDEPPGCRDNSQAALTTTQPFTGGSCHG